MKQIGIREIKTHFSRYLGLVKNGEHISITDHGHNVAMLSPYPEGGDAMKKLRSLVLSGELSGLGRNPQGLSKPVKLPKKSSISKAILEDRE